MGETPHANGFTKMEGSVALDRKRPDDDRSAAVEGAGARPDPGSPPGRARDAEADGDRTNAIVEQARAQAHYEAERIRAEARDEAERHKAAQMEAVRLEAQREAARLQELAVAEGMALRAEAEAEKQAIIAQARAQAQYEGAQLREQVVAEVDEMRRRAEADLDAFKAEQTEQARADVHTMADALREQSLARIAEEALSLRQDALSEAEQVKGAIIEHARGKASAQAARILEEAKAEAERARAEITDAARVEAARMIEEAERRLAEARDAAHLDAEVDDDAEEPDGVAPERPRPALVTAAEIGSREFPVSARGFDRESVRKWLRLVELSHGMLEEELDRARSEWQRALEALAVTRIYLGRQRGNEHSWGLPVDQELDRARGEWERSIEHLTAARPSQSESSFRAVLVRRGQGDVHVGRQLLGYSKADVREVLDASAVQIARLESQVTNLRAENEELRGRMLHQVLEPTPRFITVDDGSRTHIDNSCPVPPALLAARGPTFAVSGVPRAGSNGHGTPHDMTGNGHSAPGAEPPRPGSATE